MKCLACRKCSINICWIGQLPSVDKRGLGAQRRMPPWVLSPDPWSRHSRTKEIVQRNHCRLALMGKTEPPESTRKFSTWTMQTAVQGVILISTPFLTFTSLLLTTHCLPPNYILFSLSHSLFFFFFYISNTTPCPICHSLSPMPPTCLYYVWRSQRHILKVEFRSSTFMLGIKRNSFLCPSVFSSILNFCPITITVWTYSCACLFPACPMDGQGPWE